MSGRYNYRKNGKNYYRITKQINGIRKEFYGKSRQEAQKKMDAYFASHPSASGSSVDRKFTDACEFWLYKVKKYDDIKPSTFARYDSTYRNHIKDNDILSIKICNMTSVSLQEFVSELSESGCSPVLIKSVFKVIRMFVRYLVAESILDRDITATVKLPKDMRIDTGIRVFSENEKQIIFNNLENFNHPFLIHLGFASGMRLSEMLALEYSDCRNGGVYVNKTLTCAPVVTDVNTRKRKKQVLPPKSSNSTRFIPLPEKILKYLQHHRIRQGEKMLAVGVTGITYVFTNATGELYDNTVISKAIVRFFQKCGIKKHSAHDMRHTYITSLIKAETSIATVKELAGHSDIKMTMRYTHIGDETKRRAVESAAEIIVL